MPSYKNNTQSFLGLLKDKTEKKDKTKSNAKSNLELFVKNAPRHCLQQSTFIMDAGNSLE